MTPSRPGSRSFDSAWWGVALALAPIPVLGVFGGLAAAVLAGVWPDLSVMLLVAAAAISLTQLAWVVPAAIWAGVTGRSRVLGGVLAAAGVVFLLNGACFGLFLGTNPQW